MTTGRLNQSKYARDATRIIGFCKPCGGKMIHLSRKTARQAAKKLPAGDRSRAYPCPHAEGQWHIGHIPDAVRHGEIDRDRFRETLGGAR